jgi:hypothetical protein
MPENVHDVIDVVKERCTFMMLSCRTLPPTKGDAVMIEANVDALTEYVEGAVIDP